MVAYSYKERFIEPTWSGRKVHTIRANRTGRSRHARPGEQLQHYVGMRTKSCRLFARSICLRTEPIQLVFRLSNPSVKVARQPTLTDIRDLSRLAQSDGFKDWFEMGQFWQEEHAGVFSFTGTIIYWKDLEPVR